MRIAIAAAGLSLIGLAVGLTLWLTSGSSKSQPSPQAYAGLYAAAIDGKTTTGILDQWPKPYETYHDSNGSQCYEWFDRPSILYNLCFKNGVLKSKGLA
jgi:hypothetical protein